ncbi:MAG: nitrile hydratase subunit beta [Deltaproteobacteria bacterium]|nr:MAG: nitrile hydratase subunit beta [Deltaproteobacteria bacterium]
MNGIHDMGGMHGFGPVPVEVNEPLFHAPWESRVLGMAFQVVAAGWSNIDAFRHAIERLEPATYLSVGYYGRWLRALETILVEAGLLEPGELEACLAAAPARARAAPSTAPRQGAFTGVLRPIEAPPRFTVGDRVLARNTDTHAHGLGEHPQYVYGVRFGAVELWGADAEPGSTVHLDLFEEYLA